MLSFAIRGGLDEAYAGQQSVVTSVIMAVVNAVHGHEGEVTGLVQVTQGEQLTGNIEAGATRLLGLEGLAVLRVEADESGRRVVHVVTAGRDRVGMPDLRGALSVRQTDLVDMAVQWCGALRV